MTEDPRIGALPDSHGHAKGEHKAFVEERPIPYTARMLFLWFFHACRRGAPRFMMVADHINYLTFEDPAAVHVVRRALRLAQAGDLYGAAEQAGVELGHASVVSEGLRKGMRYSIGAEIDNDPRSRPDAQNIVDAMKPDGLIRSVHFLPITHPQHGENWMWPFDNPEFRDFYEIVGTERVWELYMETLLDAIEKLPGHIVGHFYVPARFGHWPDDATLEAYEDKLVDACAERGMAIEINSRYLYKYYVGDEAQLAKYRAVHIRLMRKAKEKGVMISVGSDAHSPRDQGSAFDEILAMLDEADINEIAFPLNDRLARVALRATEEILRQHSAALAGPPPTPPRGFATPDPADEDDDEREDSPGEPVPERRLEGRNANAEIILPPETELAVEEAEAEPIPAAAEAPAKSAPRPRKSRAKPKPAPEAIAVVESVFELPDASSEHAIAEVEVVEAAVVDSPDAATSSLPEPEAAPVPKAKPARSKRPAAPKPAEAALTAPAESAKPEPTPPAQPPPEATVVAVVEKPAPPKKAPVHKAAAPKPVPAAKKPVAKKAASTKAPAKASPVKKAAAKAAPSKKAAAKKAVPAKKAAPAKKAPIKKSPPKKVAKKPVAAKKPAKKAATLKKPIAKKPAPAKKKAPVKKSVAKRAPAKKTVAKKAAKKKSRR